MGFQYFNRGCNVTMPRVVSPYRDFSSTRRISDSPITLTLKAPTFRIMADDPHTNLQALFPGIQKEEIMATCNELNIFTSVDDNSLRFLLVNVWLSVNHFLRQDRSLNRPLASLDEFKDNVNIRGVDSFLSLLRDIAEDVRVSGFVTRWVNLFHDGTSFTFPIMCSGYFL